MKISLNNNWYYNNQYQKDIEKNASLDGFEKVHLPHTNKELEYNYFDEKLFQFVSCYKHELDIDSKYKDKIIYIHFGAVMTYAEVYLNGTLLGSHKGGYTPFSFRIDDVYNWNEKNIISVIVDSREREDIPPFGGQIDYLTYGGIYREVELHISDNVFIYNAFVKPKNVLQDIKELETKLYIHNFSNEQTIPADVICTIKKDESIIFEAQQNITITDKEQILQWQNLQNIQLWSIDNPHLYNVNITLKTASTCNVYHTKIGFRTCEFKTDGFYLNNKKLQIRGLNRHQAYPYIGYAMPERIQKKDADILKNELSLNLVRTSHYPQSVHFLNRCDEIGLLVFTEIPGWQHIGNAQWKEVAKTNVKEMIERDWNHPSIILWGVRINESPDDDEFYTDTNNIAHTLDDTRQTGGVRFIENSNLLEDVYTINDFVNNMKDVPLREQEEVTGLDHKVPYLVTEYNGHMYPTKTFDQEERQMEHSLRHLRVQNTAYANANICGAIGWCAFDYNTHKDFGSGDRICYHGVMDMFRIPKFAASVYSSQGNPNENVVLQAVTFWARGERAIGGVIPLLINTNCDYIEFTYSNFPSKRVYPNKKMFAHLPHPPIIIDESVVSANELGEWGMTWEDCVFVGYINDKPVIEKKYTKEPLPTTLSVVADDNVLHSHEKDATRIVIKVLDQCNNILPFLDDIISIHIDGPLRLQGPHTVVLKAGVIACWVETINEAGEASVSIESKILGSQTIRITIK